MNFTTTTKEITDIRRNKNGSVTMHYVTFGNKEAFVKSTRLATVKAMYYAFRESKALELTVKDGNLTFAKVI